jgi:hypothetical protein
VVRLKGGDPFIFGRGGEEVEHLRAQGITVQVVNGITAGLAGITSLGAPLTHREHAHGVLFITGHVRPGDTDTDWRAIAATARDAWLTLVIYMGVRGSAHIQEELLTGAAGIDPGGRDPARQPARPAPCADDAGPAARHDRARPAHKPLRDRGGRCGARRRGCKGPRGIATHRLTPGGPSWAGAYTAGHACV